MNQNITLILFIVIHYQNIESIIFIYQKVLIRKKTIQLFTKQMVLLLMKEDFIKKLSIH